MARLDQKQQAGASTNHRHLPRLREPLYLRRQRWRILRKGACGLGPFFILSAIFTIPGRAAEVKFEGRTFTIPAGFSIERIAEPPPAAEMRDRFPDDFRKLSTRPGFLFLVLRRPREV